MYNEKLASTFRGFIELEEKVKNIEAQNKHVLDLQMAPTISESDVVGILDEEVRIESFMQEDSGRYTLDIWRQINESISASGSEHGYDFIVGASGAGKLVCPRAASDITEDVVRYINRKYEGNE